MSYAAGAMSAKAKAMFGNRIKASDYQILLQKKTISEIASYLKKETYFSNVLSGINEVSVHRGQLEALIRLDLFDRFSNLIRYYNTEESEFYKYIIIEIEIEQILGRIRAFEISDNINFISKIPTYLGKYTTFDINKLLNIKDYDELLDLLRNTDYYPIINQYKVDDISDFDFNSFESALRKYYYDKVLKILDKEFSGKVKSDIKDVYLTRIELENITRIYRLKKYFNTPPDEIRKLLVPMYLRISKKELDEMIDHVDADKIFDYLGQTSYKHYMDDKQNMYIDYHTKMIHFNINKKYLMFSSEPDLVLFTYMVLSEVEIQNIVDIIEGARYNIASEKIEQLLIY